MTKLSKEQMISNNFATLPATDLDNGLVSYKWEQATKESIEELEKNKVTVCIEMYGRYSIDICAYDLKIEGIYPDNTTVLISNDIIFFKFNINDIVIQRNNDGEYVHLIIKNPMA